MKTTIHMLILPVIFGLLIVMAGCHKNPTLQPMDKTASSPQEAEPAQPVPAVDNTELVEAYAGLSPVFFDYDRYDIRTDQASALQKDAKFIRENQNARILLEGHCDERGTDEYNMALGDRRARAVKQYLVDLGVPASNIETISFGESKPFVEGHDESAWQQNRRAQPVALQKPN